MIQSNGLEVETAFDIISREMCSVRACTAYPNYILRNFGLGMARVMSIMNMISSKDELVLSRMIAEWSSENCRKKDDTHG